MSGGVQCCANLSFVVTKPTLIDFNNPLILREQIMAITLSQQRQVQ